MNPSGSNSNALGVRVAVARETFLQDSNRWACGTAGGTGLNPSGSNLNAVGVRVAVARKKKEGGRPWDVLSRAYLLPCTFRGVTARQNAELSVL